MTTFHLEDDSAPVQPPTTYPRDLLEWAGHRSGGVRRLFDRGSGRPSGRLIETALLARLRDWARALAAAEPGVPRIVLLVGGPGNGKTEAVEATIQALGEYYGIGGTLEARLEPIFAPTDGSTVPRIARVDLVPATSHLPGTALTLVQDASVADPSLPAKTPAGLLVDDLSSAIRGTCGDLYLACVNRGVLDDALIHATEHGRSDITTLIETVVRAVSMSPSAPECWPLEKHPYVAVWPMDVESLLAQSPELHATPSPAAQMVTLATNAERWPALGSCPAGERCPFCRSRALLSVEPNRSSLLRILRWYELSTGKRWSFRDLFSLISYLLAGAPPSESNGLSPCEWAAALVELAERGGTRPDPRRLSAPFTLLAAQYQHALLSSMPRVRRSGIRADIRDLKLETNPALMGLHHFLVSNRHSSVPGTLRSQLEGVAAALDPALADPDIEIAVSARTNLRLREIDIRFSQSVREGYSFVRKYQSLSILESDVLTRLADADDAISAAESRRRKPATAVRLQRLLRDMACQLVRRSLGVRGGVVKELATLCDYEQVVNGDTSLIHHAVKQVEGLLNERERFVVTLNTTFGEPLPPQTRRIVLETAKQKVRPRQSAVEGRPNADIRFLSIGSGSATQTIPLTYELFRSVRELQAGMMAASLPRAVIAALDTARAKLAGRIVRDEEQLDGAEIRIGVRDDVIVREMGRFLVRTNEGQ